MIHYQKKAHPEVHWITHPFWDIRHHATPDHYRRNIYNDRHARRSHGDHNSQNTSSTSGRPRVQAATSRRVAILGLAARARRPRARPLRRHCWPQRCPGGGGSGGGACCRLHKIQRRRVPRARRRHVVVLVPTTTAATATATATVGVGVRVPAAGSVIGRVLLLLLLEGATRGRRGEIPSGRRRAVGDEVLPREERGGAVLGDKVVERRAGARGDVLPRRRDQPGPAGARHAASGR